jgi:hypothetical protein
MESVVCEFFLHVKNAIAATADDGGKSSTIPYWLLLVLFALAYLLSETIAPPRSAMSTLCVRVAFMLAGAFVLFFGHANSSVFSFLAELMVAWVIYREFELNRRDRFLEVIDNDSIIAARTRLYNEFSSFIAKRNPQIGQTGTHIVTLEDIKDFAKHIDDCRPLRKAAEKIVRSFGRASLVGLDWMPAEWLPHGATLCGVILQAYVRKQREERGKDWGKRFFAIVRRAAKAYGKFKKPLRFKDGRIDLNTALEGIKAD